MRTAIVADWLPTFGGAEHVVAALHREFPSSPIFTTVARPERLPALRNADIRVSSLQLPFRLLGTHTVLLPWMPLAMEAFDLRGFDLVLSSSHAIGKGIIPPSTATHICYCHTPMRYAWEMEEDYLRAFRIPKMLRSKARNALARLRRWDMTTANRVDHFIANSTTTQERILRIYGRESTVLHPPVEDRILSSALDRRSPQERDSFLAVGRLVPYKRFDLLVETANRLHLPLQIAGAGRDRKRLQRMAGPTVEFLGFVPDAELPALYARARALLFPQIEDAGVAALEAQAAGTPVIAFRKGGALDTVEEERTGLFFAEQSPQALESALQQFERVEWDPSAIRSHAMQFSEEYFRAALSQIIGKACEERHDNRCCSE
jgi:glycosyltransferase involved in cell wall biosynthesis